MNDFIQKLPKIELHAHLNGSLKLESIRELSSKVYGPNTKEFLQLSQEFIEFDKDNKTNLEKCFSKFGFMHQLTASYEGLKMAVEMVIQDFKMDNVIYLELRTTPKNTKYLNKKDYLLCVLEVIKANNENDNGIIVTLLPSIDRSQSLQEAEETFEMILQLKSKYEDIIVGFDFSGNPAKGIFKNFQPLLQKIKNANLPLAMHCAEIANNSEEIDEMLDFGMARCGHGTFLNSSQLQRMCAAGIAIECCLTSNVKCATVDSYKDHHFAVLFRNCNKQPDVVLCTDDCGVFDTTLSQELILAANTFDLSKEDIYQLQLNAIKHCFASDSIKMQLQTAIEKYFN